MDFDETIDPQLIEYRAQLDELTQQTLDGEIDKREFIEAAEAIVIAMFAIAYLIGRGDPARMDEAIRDDKEKTIRSVRLLADDIFTGRYSQQVEDGEVVRTAERGLEMLSNRLVLWVTKLAGVYYLGKIFTRDRGVRYEWGLRPEKENCGTCTNLDGVVLTAEEWRQLGIRPQSIDLDCQGYHCGCRFIATNKPSIGLKAARRILRG